MDNQIRDEKLQYEINRATAKISALSSGKVDKYKYLTGEEILPPQQQRIIQEDRFSPLGKSFEKQTKMIQEKGEKEVKNFQSLNLTNR